MKQIFLTVIICISFLNLFSQECGFDKAHKRLLKDSNYVKASAQTEQSIKNYIKSHPIARGNNLNTVRVVPVVVHIMIPGILSNTCSYNPTDQDVLNAINFLNKVYSGDISAGMTVPSATNDVAGNLELKFELAKRTPLNSPTNGIERIYATCLQDYDDNGIQLGNSIGCKEKDLKSLASWDPSSYLNIWVVNKIAGQDGCVVGVPATIGYSSFPSDPDPKLDGIVILSRAIINPNNNVNAKKILAHEVGHYFSLYHPFEGANGSVCPLGNDIDCLDSGDKVCDTDPVTQSNDICRTGNNNFCTYSPYTYKENTENNIMGYTDCRTLFTIGQKTRVLAALNHPRRISLFSPNNKALESPTPNQYFSTCTNPIFTTNDFTCISVGKDGNVWAGTYQKGLYKFSPTSIGWEKAAVLDNNAINDIKSDQNGGIWIAQSGRNADVAFDGGIEYFPDASFSPQQHYGGTVARPARYILNLFVDTTRLNPGNLPVVWSANWYNSTGGNYTSGGLGKGLNTIAAPGFDLIREGIQTTYNFGNLRCVGGNATEIWAYSKNNYNRSQILVYDAQTGLIKNPPSPYDYQNTVSANYLTNNFAAKAIFFDKNGNKWIGMQDGGLVVVDKDNIWYNTLNFSNIFPLPTNPPTPPIITSTYVNSNAITGDTLGNVFIGTNNGLIVYNGGPIDKECSYKRYTTNDGLTSNNVRGICVDLPRRKLLLATDNGINFWSPINTTGSSTQPYVTTTSGNMNNSSVWCGGTVPPSNSDVTVKHAITITSNTILNSLRTEPGGSVVVLSGVSLTLTNQH